MTDLIDTFIKLCSIPSPSGDEKEIGAEIERQLKRYVDEISTDSVGNIFAKKTGTSGHSPILLCAHMDTVEPAGRQDPVIVDGIIKSNGTVVLGADDKAAVAVIIDVLKELKEKNIKHTDIEILITVREETDAGIKDFPRERILSNVALLADISRPIGAIITAAPFVCGYSIEVKAPGSHVSLMSEKTVHPLNFLERFKQRVPFGRVSDNTIVNIAKVRMGESYNSIPQKLHFTGEIRTFETDYYDRFLETLQKAVKAIDKEVGTESTLTLYPYCKGYMLKESDILPVKNAMKGLGITAKPITAYSVGDFNILCEWGIMPINIGTGALEVHTTRERISIEDLTKLRDILLESVCNYSRK